MWELNSKSYSDQNSFLTTKHILPGSEQLVFHISNQTSSRIKGITAERCEMILSKGDSRHLRVLRYLMYQAKRSLGGERNLTHSRLFCCLPSSTEFLSTLNIHKHRLTDKKTDTDSSHTETSRRWIKHTCSGYLKEVHIDTHGAGPPLPKAITHHPPPFGGMVRLFLLLK